MQWKRFGEFGDTSEKKTPQLWKHESRRISMPNICEVRVPEKENEETDDSLYLKKE